MEKLDLAKNIMKARILTQNACESFHKSSNKKQSLPIQTRILFLIQEYGKVSPTLLIEKLYIAKSNLALMCKKLITLGYIQASQDLIDKRVIYYCLTPSGQEYLQQKLKSIENNLINSYTQQELQIINEKLIEINEILNKKF